jgi:hypothetical protein
MALEPAPEVAAAAAAILVNWPEGAALEQLVEAAERSGLAEVRATALQGAMKVVERRRAKPAAEPSDLVARLLAASKDASARRQLVFLLGRGSSDSALALARSLQADPALAGEAREAALAIRANRQWPPRLKASANGDLLGYLVDGDRETAWWAPANANPWIQEDFGRSRPVRRITLDQTGRLGDFPERYEVFVTDDPDAPGQARAAGAGESEKTVIELPAGTHGRYLIIRDIAASGSGSWSVSELQVD